MGYDSIFILDMLFWLYCGGVGWYSEVLGVFEDKVFLAEGRVSFGFRKFL